MEKDLIQHGGGPKGGIKIILFTNDTQMNGVYLSKLLSSSLLSAFYIKIPLLSQNCFQHHTC